VITAIFLYPQRGIACDYREHGSTTEIITGPSCTQFGRNLLTMVLSIGVDHSMASLRVSENSVLAKFGEFPFYDVG
jgi:hypothetical protein